MRIALTCLAGALCGSAIAMMWFGITLGVPVALIGGFLGGLTFPNVWK